MKRLHKLIVTSATYRQSSHARPDLAETDPLNTLLARQNRLRVEAEIVRDAALSASGLLHPKIGGPGVRPPQPEGVYAFTQSKKAWTAATGRTATAVVSTSTFTAARLIRSSPPSTRPTSKASAPRARPFEHAAAIARPRKRRGHLRTGAGTRGAFVEGSAVDNEKRLERAFFLCYARPPSDRSATRSPPSRDAGDLVQGRSVAAAEVGPKVPGIDPAEAASWTTVARGADEYG